MKQLRVGILDSHFRSYAPSIVNNQQLPPSFQYLDWETRPEFADVVMATCSDAQTLLDYAPRHPHKVIWLQESAEVIPHPADDVLARYDLVLSSDLSVVERFAPKSGWLTLLGTWITDFSGCDTKIGNVSMIASDKGWTSGHKLRHEVAAKVTGYTAFGKLFGPRIPQKDAALKPYRFTVAIENSNVRDWWTEKTADAFACKAVPFFWGCDKNLDSFATLGFDPSGIIPFYTATGLQDLIELANQNPHEMYEERRAAVEHNWARVQELRCAEIRLEQILREYFGL